MKGRRLEGTGQARDEGGRGETGRDQTAVRRLRSFNEAFGGTERGIYSAFCVPEPEGVPMNAAFWQTLTCTLQPTDYNQTVDI